MLVKNQAEVKAAITKELDGMYALRFERAHGLTDQQMMQAKECRLLITRKRPTPEEIACGVSLGVFKARLVCKDLKCWHRMAPEETYAPVPGLLAFRLLMAAYRCNASMSRISTTDFSQAFLQADEYADGQRRLMKYRDPD